MIMHLAAKSARRPKSLPPRLDDNGGKEIAKGRETMKIDEKTACIEDYHRWVFRFKYSHRFPGSRKKRQKLKREYAHIAWTIRQHGRERGWIE